MMTNITPHHIFKLSPNDAKLKLTELIKLAGWAHYLGNGVDAIDLDALIKEAKSGIFSLNPETPELQVFFAFCTMALPHKMYDALYSKANNIELIKNSDWSLAIAKFMCATGIPLCTDTDIMPLLNSVKSEEWYSLVLSLMDNQYEEKLVDNPRRRNLVLNYGDFKDLSALHTACLGYTFDEITAALRHKMPSGHAAIDHAYHQFFPDDVIAAINNPERIRNKGIAGKPSHSSPFSALLDCLVKVKDNFSEDERTIIATAIVEKKDHVITATLAEDILIFTPENKHAAIALAIVNNKHTDMSNIRLETFKPFLNEVELKTIAIDVINNLFDDPLFLDYVKDFVQCFDAIETKKIYQTLVKNMSPEKITGKILSTIIKSIPINQRKDFTLDICDVDHIAKTLTTDFSRWELSNIEGYCEILLKLATKTDCAKYLMTKFADMYVEIGHERYKDLNIPDFLTIAINNGAGAEFAQSLPHLIKTCSGIKEDIIKQCIPALVTTSPKSFLDYFEFEEIQGLEEAQLITYRNQAKNSLGKHKISFLDRLNIT